MAASIQDLISSFADNRHQDVVNSVDLKSFNSSDNPFEAKIVAASFFKLGDYKRSLSILSQIESCFCDDIEFLSLYGACLRRNGDLDKARVQLESALKLNPEASGSCT